MSEENKFWKSKVIRGIGTLIDFVKEYDLVSSLPGQFINASTTTLTGNVPVEDVRGIHKLGIYEWIIFYKRNPKQDNINKTIIQESGEIIESKPVQVLSLE